MDNKTLACIDQVSAAQVFTATGIDPLIQAVRAEVLGIAPDLLTVKGRAEVKARAFKVSRSKTALDDAGKALVAGKKAEIKVVDNARKKMRDELDVIRDEVRRPLNEWEGAEAIKKAEADRIENARIGTIQACISDMRDAAIFALGASADDMARRLEVVTEITIDESFAEFQPEAERAKAATVHAITSTLETRRQYESEQEELVRLRAQQAEEAAKIKAQQEEIHRQREEQEANNRAAQEAVDRQRLEVEEKERRMQQEKDDEVRRLKVEREAKARAVSELIEKQKREAVELAAQQAEQERLNAAQPEKERLRAWAAGDLQNLIDSVPVVNDSELVALTVSLNNRLRTMRKQVLDLVVEEAA